MKRPPSLHVPGAFPLAGAPRLPLTGEEHPLRREFVRWLGWANGAALALGLLLFAGWYILSHMKKEEGPVMREVRIVRYTELGVPPSISRAAATVPQIKIAQAVAPPSIGVPQPVPDTQARTTTIATQEQMSEALAPITMGDLGGTGQGESLVVKLDTTAVEHSPTPEEFVAVEEQPVRLRIDPPIYPDVARQAGIEGTVIVRALVGKDGRVKNCLVLEGPDMLKDAAVVCAKTAVFKPALLQNKPVEVWVMMPITFQLREGAR